MSQALYLVCEAKFMGEGPHVGRETVVAAIRSKDLRHFEIHLPADNRIKQFTKAGDRRAAEEVIEGCLKEQKWHEPLTP
jgi:hypothetical protein